MIIKYRWQWQSHLMAVISTCFHLFCIVTAQGQEMTNIQRHTSNMCNENIHCQLNAYCKIMPQSTMGHCVCHPGYIIMSEHGQRECYKTALKVGDICAYHEQCMITFSTESECYMGRCRCRLGTHFIQRENTCYKSSKIGDYCRLTNNCLGEGSVCRSGRCYCPIDKHPNSDRIDCLEDINLGESCRNDDECVTANTRCAGGMCHCRFNHIMSQNGTQCLQVAHYLHGSCQEDIQCTERLQYSICDTKTKSCICKNGYHKHNNKCWVSVQLDGKCEVDENCSIVQNAVCIQGRCKCHSSNSFSNEGYYCSSSLYRCSSQRVLVIILIINLFYLTFYKFCS